MEKGPSFLLSIILAVVIILIWVVSVSRQNAELESYIEGMWIAGEDFCKRADIDGMLVYIGPTESFGMMQQTRRAYIIMHSNGVVITTKNVDITMSGITINPIMDHTIVRELSITDLDDNDGPNEINIDDIMPTEMNCEICIYEGRMSWIDDEGTSYAELFKSYQPKTDDE